MGYIPGENREDILRLLFETCTENPFEFVNIGTFMTLKTIDSSFLQQQENWVIDWVKIDYDSGDYIEESEWQILNDPDGIRLQEMLQKYPESSHVWIGTRANFLGFLKVISNNRTNHDLMKACINHMAVLLTCGFDARWTYWKRTWIEKNASKYAIFTDTVRAWEEALSLAGWMAFEIKGLLDEAWYLGLPELFDGFIYMTKDECAEEFKAQLVTGTYLDISAEESLNISDFYYFHADLSSLDLRSLMG